MTNPPSRTQPLRISIQRLAKLVLLVLIVPLAAAYFLDNLIGIAPWATIVAIIVCIPLATILVSRAALHEMDKVIQVVAPSEQLDRE